jgi:hypothetical protein
VAWPRAGRPSVYRAFVYQQMTEGFAAPLALPSVAAAGTYPPPANPGTPRKPPKGPFHRLEVCKDDCRYHSEKYAPDEDNVITDNDVFWNNFNYYAEAPFKLRKSGVGVLKQVLLKQTDAADPVGNQVRDNQLGLGGADLNGRDLVYDGTGSNNWFGPNVGVAVTVPADRSAFAPCPFTGANAFNAAVQAEAFGWAGDTTHEKFWIKHPHAAKKGYTPPEHYGK